MNLVKNFLLHLSLFLSFIYAIYGFIKPVSLEYDLGRHLLFGRIMFETQRVISTNLLSYTNTDFKYVNSHWLFEIGAYLLNQALGFNGLIFLTAVLSFITIFILFRFTYSRVSLSALAITLPIYLSFMISRLDVRPELFSYLFIAIFITTLFEFRENRTKLIYVLIPISILWVNLHIYFAVGLGLIFLFFMESLILNKFKLTQKNNELLMVLALCSISVFINPNFINGVLFPITVFNNYGIEIQENLSLISVGKLTHIIFIVFLLIFTFIYRKKMTLVEILIVTFFSIFAIMIYRNFYLLLIVSFFTFSKLTSYFLDGIGYYIKKYVNFSQLNILKSLSYFFLCIIIISLISFQINLNQESAQRRSEHGKSAIDFFLKNNLKGPIYNSFNLGQYLSYRLYPRELVYVDARPEAYPAIFLKEDYENALYDFDLFKKEDKKYDFNTLFILPSYYKDLPLIKNLINDDKFKLVYFDSNVLVFVKNNEENKKIIDEHQINDDTFYLSGNEDTYTLMGYVLFFDEIGWKKAEIAAFEKLSKIENGLCSLRISLERRSKENQKLMNIRELPDVKCY